jgi:anti-sigma B factor antagonist
MLAFKLEYEKSERSGGVYVTKLRGRLMLETVNGFISELRAETAQRLVLDMSEISFLDSAGMGALVQVMVHRRNQQKPFALAALTPQAIAVMQVSGLVKLMPTFSTVDEAAASLR